MGLFGRLIDTLTLGSERPIRRLATYYAVIGLVAFLAIHFSPFVAGLFAGEHLDDVSKAPVLLADGLQSGAAAVSRAPAVAAISSVSFGLATAFAFLSTLALMLPVTWVYMSSAPGRTT